MNNILVVNVNWLGDAIFSTPVFKALKEAYPESRITCLCPPRVKAVMLHCPFVDHVIVYDEEHKHRWLWKKLSLIKSIKHEQFDVAILIHRSLTRALLTYLAGIPRRVGFSKAKWLLTHAVALPPASEHRSLGYLKVLEGLDLKPVAPVCQLRLHDEDIDAVEQLLRTHQLHEGRYIVFHPAGNWDLKRWPVAYWVQLAHAIKAQDASMSIVLTGSEAEQCLCEDIAKGFESIINLVGQTRLGQSLVIFKKAKIVITGDSGPLHLANSVGATTIALFGPTRPELTGPRGLGKSVIIQHQVGCNKAPCYHLDCRDNVCMKSISVEDVCREIKALNTV